MGEKTEQPTPRKLRRAEEEGDSPVSAALVQAAAFVAALALAPAALAATAARFDALVRLALEAPERTTAPIVVAWDVLVLSLPLVAAAALVSVAIGVVQTGGIVAMKKVTPDLARLDPFTGLQNLFSGQRLLAVARAFVTALLVGWLAVRLVLDHARDLQESVGKLDAGLALAADLTRRIAWIAALVGLALAGFDVIVTRRAWLKRLMMTKDEIKREYKESEGDPEIKAARRRAHQEMLAGATVNAVKDATVVIVNPTHLATALHYDEDEDQAPRIVGQGEGELAKKMIDAARAYGIPIVRDVPVARALSELEVGDEIPEALYEAVAEILREVWEQAEREAGGASET